MTDRRNAPTHRQSLYPVVDGDGRLQSVITRQRMAELATTDSLPSVSTLAVMGDQDPVVAYPDEPLRVVVYRMAETGFTRMPVVERGDTAKLAGMISLEDLLHARTRNLTEERSRERVLRIRLPFQGVAVKSS